MRQAITTKFLGPTNCRDSRVKATAQAGTATVAWDHALNQEENHAAAARKLANKFDWLANDWTLECGALPDGTGNVYVLVACLHEHVKTTVGDCSQCGAVLS